MKLRTCIAVLLVATASTVWAQPVPSTAPPSTADSGPKPPAPASSKSGQTGSLEKNFFAPELIMQHQNAIGLTADQRTAIRAEMQRMMAEFTDLQWQESAETEAWETLVRQARPDEQKVLAQLDKLLNIENQIKRLHTGMLVRIKNLLTSEQQAQLQELTRGSGPRPRALREKETK
jgi:Spy/CpxP family protein refolding chaperone